MNGTQDHPHTAEGQAAAAGATQGQSVAQPAPPAAGAAHPGYAPGAAPYAQPGPTPTATPRIEDPRRKSPLLACILSIIPGLGQVYVGYYQRGFIHAIVVASIFATLIGIGDYHAIFPFAIVFLIFFWMYNIIDAGRRAAMFNHVLAGGEIESLPQDISIPGMRGSIVGGLTVIAIGAIILSHTAWNVPLDWLEDWWPLSLFIFGAWLLVKGIRER